MINKYYLDIGLFLLFLLFSSCNTAVDVKKDTIYINKLGALDLQPKFKVYLNEFLDSSIKCRDCIYEMIVDKKDYQQTTIGLRCYGRSTKVFPELSRSMPPINEFVFNNQLFYVYSGIEDIFYIKNSKNMNENGKYNSEDVYLSWCIILDRDSSGYYNVTMDKNGCAEFIGIHKLPSIYYQ